ncbi:CpsD/CapB family tyrosine-protein kinase [Candidatus Zixiibacteriota bacterium]
MPNEKETPVVAHRAPQPQPKPQAKKWTTGDRKPRSLNKTIVDIFRAEGMPAAEFRRICDGIGWTTDSAEKPAGPKKVLITSAMTNEGKSTVAALTALTSAVYLDQRTLLLDCDMRRPSIHRMFRETLPGGLSDCLSGTATFDSCVHVTAIDKLKVLTAGTAVGNPSELLTHDRLTDLIAEASFYFDRMVIDCAPVIPVDDAVTLGRIVDGLLMVVRAGSTQREVVRRATQIIRDSKLNLLGVILNNLDEALPYYYSQKYYGAHYKHGSY